MPVVKAMVVLDVKWNHKTKELGTGINSNNIITKRGKGNINRNTKRN